MRSVSSAKAREIALEQTVNDLLRRFGPSTIRIGAVGCGERTMRCGKVRRDDSERFFGKRHSHSIRADLGNCTIADAKAVTSRPGRGLAA